MPFLYAGYVDTEEQDRPANEPPHCDCGSGHMSLVTRNLKPTPLRELRTYRCAKCDQIKIIELE